MTKKQRFRLRITRRLNGQWRNLFSNLSPVKPPPMEFIKYSDGFRISNVTMISMRAGTTPMTAEVMAAANDIGTIEPGKMADMLLLDEDPLKDISALEKIRVLIFNGQIATKEVIDHQLKALESTFHNFLHTKITRKTVELGNQKGFSHLIPDPPGGWENQ